MKTEAEINDLLDRVDEMENFRNMTYQDGLKAALDWVLENITEDPTR